MQWLVAATSYEEFVVGYKLKEHVFFPTTCSDKLYGVFVIFASVRL